MNEEPCNENKCETCSKKSSVACISFFTHENAMMHKDLDNERLHETIKLMSEQHTKDIERMSEQHSMDIRNILIGFFVVIMLFVVTYTIRTNIWNDTVKYMNAAIVELAHATSNPAP